jgi:ankyrin repeat protein
VAARSGKSAALRFLLKAGVPLPSEAEKQGALLKAAIESHQTEVLRTLIEGGLQPGAAAGEPPLVIAARERQREMVDLLVPLSAGHEAPALFAACRTGDVSVIDSLIKAGASVFQREPETLMTPLMVAVEAGQRGAAELLLASGSNRFALDAKGRSALDLATDAEQPSFVTLLSTDPSYDEKCVPVSANGRTVDLGRTTLVQPHLQITFLGLHEKTLPFVLIEADPTGAVIQAEGQKPATKIGLEEPVPGTDWKVEKAVATGLFFQPNVTLRQRGSSERLLLVKGLPTRDGEARAWLKFIGDEQVAEANVGDQFILSGEKPTTLKVESISAMSITLVEVGTQARFVLKPGGIR